MFDHWYALDIGGHSIRIIDINKDTSWQARSVIAWKQNDVQACGVDAFPFIYQDQRVVSVKYPINHDQVLSPFAPLIKKGMKELKASNNIFHPHALVLIPSESHMERLENWRTQINEAGIHRLDFVRVSDLLQTQQPTLCIHAGHTYTELGVYTQGACLNRKTIFYAGKQIDEAIQTLVATKYRCLISEEDAVALKEAASKSLSSGKQETLLCNAKNQYNQFVQLQIRASSLWPCIQNVAKQIVLWAKQSLESLDIETKEIVHQNGILLSGGLANCFGIKETLEQELNMKVYVSNHPEWELVQQLKEWG